jgi:adenylate kinase family enzyme
MPRVVFVLGLCGSGKSFRAKELADQGFRSFDEKITGRPVHPDWPNTAYFEFVQAVVDGENCVVTDIAFYSRDLRQRVISELKSKRSDAVIEWECFDIVDRETANYNCEHDPERTMDDIKRNLKQNQETFQYLQNDRDALPADCKRLPTVRRAGG